VKVIYLTGFMGAGKSSVGKRLSSYIHQPFVDLDEFIERKTKKKIRKLFEEIGEVGFRQYEQAALQQLPSENIIVATGGGIVTIPDNIKTMKNQGMIIYLQCDFNTILTRLKEDNSRPLILGKSHEEIKTLYEKRIPLYKDADLTIDTNHKPVDKVAAEISYMLSKNILTLG
jgi:shikimate kinase